MSLVKNILNQLNEYFEESQFNVGDKVLCLVGGRVGTVKQKIQDEDGEAVYEVEMPETEANMAKTDRFYADDLELFNPEFYESMNEDEHVRTYSVTVEVEVPANMNNIETEEAIESAIEQKYADVIKVVYIDSNAIL